MAAAAAAAAAAIPQVAGFEIHSVDHKLEPGNKLAQSPQSAPIGVLSNFNGNFKGRGFNSIFRPSSGAVVFQNPFTPPAPTPPNENILELNLTTETLEFKSQLGSTPNRGLEKQTDIFLNGVPYVQAINDVTNLATGNGDGTPIGIHFEPGLWMHIPATAEDPVLPESLNRMGSIPHGTTINAQLTSNGIMLNKPGAPDFINVVPPVNLVPFPIGTDQSKTALNGTFHALDASNNATSRLPQDLTKFISTGTITQAILNNPNVVLQNAIQGQTITQNTFFTVSTLPSNTIPGGGTANNAFLVGGTASPQVGPNAQAAQMNATFWIETVQAKLVVPAFTPGQAPLKLTPALPNPNTTVPTFVVTPPNAITSPVTITVTYTQIQYSQLVNLNFAGLTWPHASVATLVPAGNLTVPASAFQNAS